MSGPQQRKAAADLKPAVAAACDRILDVVATTSEDVHDGTQQLNAALTYLQERLQAALREAVQDIEGMITERRQEKRARAAAARLASETKVDPGPPKLEIAGLPE